MIPIRQEIEVLPAGNWEVIKTDIHDRIAVTSKGKIIVKDNRPLVLGWKVKETIGIAVVNSRGVSKGRKSVIIGQ